MTIPHYGVWVGRPIDYKLQGHREDPRSPHIYLFFKDDLPGIMVHKAAINVKSLDEEDSRLVAWLFKDFTHPLTRELENMGLGFKFLPMHGGLRGLDYIRTADGEDALISDIRTGRVLPDNRWGPNNDILDEVVPILDSAIEEKATVYIFGSSFGSGIHDIHMNQGSVPPFDNGIGQDGGLIVRFPNGHWEAIFLAFASQRIPTDDNGFPLRRSRSLAKIIGV